MRILQTILFSLIIYSSYGQGFYIEGKASPVTDSLYNRANKYYTESNLELAKKCFDSLEVEWTKIIDSNPQKDHYQNYYFIKSKLFRTKRRMRSLSLDEIEDFIKLEASLKQNLSENNIVIGYYYSALAKAIRTIRSDLNTSIYYSNKSIETYNQNLPSCLDQIGRELVQMGYGYRRITDFEKAESYFLQSIEIKEKIRPIATRSILFSKYALAAVYLDQMKFDQALELNLEVVEKAPMILEKGHNLIYNSLDAASIIYKEKGDNKKSLEYAFASLNSLNESNDDKTYKLEKIYQGISSRYRVMGKYKLAQQYLDSSFNLVIHSKDHNAIASAYNAKALLTQNSDEELRFLKNAIDYCHKDIWCSEINLPIFLTNLGIYYEKKGDSHTALNYYLKSKDVKENNIEKTGSSLPDSYKLLATSYENIGLEEKADYYHNKAIATTLKYRGENNQYIAAQYNSYGFFLLNSNKFDKAEIYLKKTSDILKKDSAGRLLTYCNHHRYLSRLYEKQGKYSKSLTHATISYESSGDFYHSSKIQAIKQLISINQKMGKIDSCENLLSELLEVSGYSLNETKDKKHQLDHMNYWLAYDSFFSYLKLENNIVNNQDFLIKKIKYGLLLIRKLRSEYFFEVSEKKLQTSLREYYNWSILKLGKQYNLTKDSSYLSLIYVCIEQSKSLLIDRQKIKQIALSKLDLPEDILDQEENILYSYEKSYNKFVNQKGSSDSLKRKNKENLYSIQNQKESFLDSIQQLYPEYYSSRYDQNITTLDECKELTSDGDHTFIIYHWGDSILHKLTVDKAEVDYADILISDIELKLSQLTKFTKTPLSEIPESKYKDDKEDFIRLSRELFQSLIGNSYTLPKSLTIIPDNNLVHLPFEILLYEDPDGTKDYRSLPYLLTQSAINYNGSISQYQSLIEQTQTTTKEKYIGFSPSYTKTISYDSIGMINTRGEVTNSQLLYNTTEVIKSKEHFDGVAYIAEQATEQNFKENASHSHILHLAMHTKVISNQPYDTYLQFEPNKELNEDGRLYLDEIAKLNINSNLVVLSACETNIGENIIGESIHGIARAFQIASCPNIVLTNWLIDDKSSSKIIPQFLEGIKKHQQPAVALQKAKQEYLKTCSQIQSHPYYWSAYSYYGAPEIKNPNSKTLKTLLILTLSMLFLLIVFKFFRNISN